MHGNGKIINIFSNRPQTYLQSLRARTRKIFGKHLFSPYFCAVEKVTINDIARLTGLSKGTVDRVLHNRGEVSRKSYLKVMDIIKELGY